jgi:hypothetical protein
MRQVTFPIDEDVLFEMRDLLLVSREVASVIPGPLSK